MLTRLYYLPEAAEPQIAQIDPSTFGPDDLDRLVDGMATEATALTRIFYGGSVERCRAFMEVDAMGLDLPENRAVMRAWGLVEEPPVEVLRGPVVVLIGPDADLEQVEIE